MDEIIYFNPLSCEAIRRIVQDKIEVIEKRLKSKGIELQVTDDVVSFLSTQGYSVQFGAKFVVKNIEEKLLKPLTDYLLAAKQKQIIAKVDNGVVTFQGD